MTWGFERDRVYNRRADIHARFRGQQQGGIITPSGFPLVIIITGEEGLQHGYSDRWRADGVFEYFGEGQIGDMTFRAGNRAIAAHSQNGKQLLLFRKEREGLRYIDELVYEAHHTERAPDREGRMRDAIVFELRPLANVIELEAVPEATALPDLERLRQQAMEAANATPERQAVRTTAIERSNAIRTYVAARAGGHCEGCSAPAPFYRPNGTPYLEPHHIRRLSDGGPDDPRFVIALCPNCHRRVHSGADGREYNEDLLARMREIER